MVAWSIIYIIFGFTIVCLFSLMLYYYCTSTKLPCICPSPR
eukprot:UN10223